MTNLKLPTFGDLFIQAVTNFVYKRDDNLRSGDAPIQVDDIRTSTKTVYKMDGSYEKEIVVIEYWTVDGIWLEYEFDGTVAEFIFAVAMESKTEE